MFVIEFVPIYTTYNWAALLSIKYWWTCAYFTKIQTNLSLFGSIVGSQIGHRQKISIAIRSFCARNQSPQCAHLMRLYAQQHQLNDLDWVLGEEALKGHGFCPIHRKAFTIMHFIFTLLPFYLQVRTEIIQIWHMMIIDAPSNCNLEQLSRSGWWYKSASNIKSSCQS